jgi:hypothetical protein
MPYAKHESFHIRQGWLSKGMEAIRQDPRVLRRETAPMDLGLGRNMVRALRFWLVATGLTKQEWENQLVQALTPFGEMVWRYDRYLENEGTLWLIHSLTTYCRPRLSNRVAQNERTLCTFLASEEPDALGLLLTKVVPDTPEAWVCPDRLWDYFAHAIRADAGAGDAHPVWAGVETALRKMALEPLPCSC